MSETKFAHQNLCKFLNFTHYSKSQIFVQKFNFDQTLTFSRVFHPKKIDNFLGISKLKFWTKNEDFEQCAIFGIFVPKITKITLLKKKTMDLIALWVLILL